MKKRNVLVLAFFAGALLFLAAQEAQGLEPLPSALSRAMSQAQPRGLVSGRNALPGDGTGSSQLPRSVDLSPFLPPVRSQGKIGSCSAWSTVYYAKSLQENRERGWDAFSEEHQYSPLFTYNQITRGVNKGTSIVEHMIILEEQGAAPLSVFPHIDDISVLPDSYAKQEASRYRAASHKKLDKYNERTGAWEVKLQTVKTALAEGLPVIAGFQVYENLRQYRGGVYSSTSGRFQGGHAMCIVGYDDDTGTLLIVNSWGTNWGDEGFLHLDYRLFESLCTYNCAVMYDLTDTVPRTIAAPLNMEGSKGGYTDKISLDWESVDDAQYYLVYRSNNENGELEELARTEETFYADRDLPPGVSYIYAVKSGKRTGGKEIVSSFSEITEAWTGEEKSPPGIPGSLVHSLFEEGVQLSWDPVEEAQGYHIYRWKGEEEAFMNVGASLDNRYLDRDYARLEPGIYYYIVEAWNMYGKGFGSDSLAVVKPEPLPDEEEENNPPPPVPEEEKDDIPVIDEKQKPFDGEYYRTDYFDFAFTQARFREFYEREQEAFRNFRREEMSAFEAWKKANGY